MYFASLCTELRGDESGPALGLSLDHVLDDESLQNVTGTWAQLRAGVLPAATPQVFPRPTLLHLARIPVFGNATLCLYDVAGETFLSGAAIGRYAPFVAPCQDGPVPD